MGLVSPLYALTIIPSLVLVTIPLAILAAITTTVAFSVLLLRVITVYLDLVISFVPQSLTGAVHSSSSSSSSSPTQQQLPQHRPRSLKLAQSPPPPPLVLSSPHSSTRSLHHHRRRRRSSASVTASIPATVVGERGLGLMPSVGADRDYEGIGGWRAARGHNGGPSQGGGDDDDDDELAWTTVNPPLQLQLPRHHARSASGPSFGVAGTGVGVGPGTGPTTPGEGGTYLVMRSGRTKSPEVRTGKRVTPNCSRARTPSGPRPGLVPPGTGQLQHPSQSVEGYFALNHGAAGPAQSTSGSQPKVASKVSAQPVDYS